MGSGHIAHFCHMHDESYDYGTTFFILWCLFYGVLFFSIVSLLGCISFSLSATILK